MKRSLDDAPDRMECFEANGEEGLVGHLGAAVGDGEGGICDRGANTEWIDIEDTISPGTIGTTAELRADYNLLCSAYDFFVDYNHHLGKHIRVKREVVAGEVILVESPLVVWPIRASCDLMTLEICENCMRLRHPPASLCRKQEGNCSPGSNTLSLTTSTTDTAKSGHDCGVQTAELSVTTQPSLADHVTSKDDPDEETLSQSRQFSIDGQHLWFCCDTCAIQSLGQTLDRVGVSDRSSSGAGIGIHRGENGGGNVGCDVSGDEGVKFVEAPLPLVRSKQASVGGWMNFLTKAEIMRLRKVQEAEDSNRDVPITYEAVARIIAKVSATMYHLVAVEELPLQSACHLAMRPYDRLVAPEHSNIQDIDGSRFFFEVSRSIRDNVVRKFGKDVATLLLSYDTVQQLLSRLILNSQALNVWGAHCATGVITFLKAAAVYTIQSCFNHSCVPNCTITCTDDATLSISTQRHVTSNEELTISYVDCGQNHSKRQELLANYLFVCTCSKCLAEQQGFST